MNLFVFFLIVISLLSGCAINPIRTAPTGELDAFPVMIEKILSRVRAAVFRRRLKGAEESALDTRQKYLTRKMHLPQKAVR